ncbi:MAG: endonuclease III domain-containing protein [Smithellaceae bacterium]|nr:endonuclease III domain-containing protein [Smithellaceae bacterium]
MRRRRPPKKLILLYERLNGYFGPLRWWPGETPFEVICGAILTQNTAWHNVEKAIGNLKKVEICSFKGIRETSEEQIATLIRPSGYYHIKTARLKAFVSFLEHEYGGDMKKMFAEETISLREKLLGVKGIGEETADSILLYAGGKPVFVVDAYTRRVLCRHGLISEGVSASYAAVQQFFMGNLEPDVELFNQFHALFVNLGKKFCRKVPLCRLGCPLYGTPFSEEGERSCRMGPQPGNGNRILPCRA